MAKVGEHVLESFEDELAKHSAGLQDVLPHLARRGVRHAMQAGLGAGAGVGAASGAALGGTVSGIGAYRSARQSGESRGNALGRALLSGAQGAAVGAAGGALTLGAGGALAGAVRPLETRRIVGALSGRGDVAGAAARFGQREIHGFTGYRPRGSTRSLEQIRAGAYDARKSLESALLGDDDAAVARALKHFHAAEDTQSRGITSLPGLAKGLVKDTTGTARSALRTQWTTGGWGHRALTFGLPLGVVGVSATTREDPGVPRKAERVGRAVGSLGMTLAPLGIGSSLLLGSAMDRAGGAAGRALDRARGRAASPDSGPSESPRSA